MPVSIKLPASIASGGIDTSDANAQSNNILDGYTAYVNNQKIIGNIKSKAAQVYVPSTNNQDIQSGVYLSGNQTILGDGNLRSENIKADTSIFGVSGDSNVVNTRVDNTNDAISSDNVLQGKVGYVNGKQVVGQVRTYSQAYTEITPNTQQQVIASPGSPIFINNGLAVKGDSNLVPSNIKAGVSIFGVAGTYVGNTSGGGGGATSSKITVPIWINQESSISTLGNNIYFKDNNNSAIDFASAVAYSSDICSASTEYAIHYSQMAWNWGNTVRTVCTTPIYITPDAFIKYVLMSEDRQSSIMRLVTATGEGSELVSNILNNANTQGLYYDIGLPFLLQSQRETFYRAVPTTIPNGYYYLYWEVPTNNVKGRFYEISVLTTEEV